MPPRWLITLDHPDHPNALILHYFYHDQDVSDFLYHNPKGILHHPSADPTGKPIWLRTH